MPPETIYIPLMNEGTPVWRPVEAERSASHAVFQVLGVMAENEEWAYRPGQLVFAKQHTFADGKTALVAYALAPEGSSISSTLIEVTPKELMIACNALNEVCNGVGLGDEFETRMGSTVNAARSLLDRLLSILGK